MKQYICIDIGGTSIKSVSYTHLGRPCNEFL